MTQRNPMNERYQSEDRKGATRKSAASAKPVSKAASSVRIQSTKKTPQQKKAERKQQRAKDAQRDRQFYNPPTAEYKRLRKIWWVCLILAIILTVVSFAGNNLGMLCGASALTGLGYGFGGMIASTMLINRWFRVNVATVAGVAAVGSGVAAGAGEGLALASATGIASVSVQPQTVQTRSCSPSSLSVGSCVTVQSPKVCAPVSVRSLPQREYFCVCSVSVTVHSGTQPSAWFERSISPYLSPQTSHFARRRQVGVPPVCSPAAGIAVPELSRASQSLQYVSPV